MTTVSYLYIFGVFLILRFFVVVWIKEENELENVGKTRIYIVREENSWLQTCECERISLLV